MAYKNKTTLSLFVVLSLLAATCYSQSSVGIKVNPGISKVSVHSEAPYLSKETYYLRPSGQAGFFYTFSEKNYLIGGEIFFSQMEGKCTHEWDEPSLFGGPTFTSNAVDYEHISYLSIPLYVGFSYKKLNFNVGFQFNDLLARRGMDTEIIKNSANGDTVTFRSKGKLPLYYQDYGPRVGVFFRLNKSFSLEANYYYGLTNIYRKSDYWTMTVQQASFGIRYSFISK